MDLDHKAVKLRTELIDRIRNELLAKQDVRLPLPFGCLRAAGSALACPALVDLATFDLLTDGCLSL